MRPVFPRTFVITAFVVAALFAGLGRAAEVPREGPSVNFRHGRLKVSDNQRFLVHEDGTPFFYLGDTNWELFHGATRAEAAQLIENRRQKGFTVLQVIALGHFGVDKPNSHGDVPFENGDTTRPLITPGANPDNADEYDYWDHIDYIVALAAKHGLYIGFLPAWRTLVEQKVINVDNARAYGEFLGRRYKDAANIIWILGGDINVRGMETLWREMAAGLRSQHQGRQLMTYHPQGNQTSATWFHEDDWLDFNMLQSGHQSPDNPNDESIEKDYNRAPPKPCIDGEARYEDHAINWRTANGWFQPHDIRQAAYWALFAGAFGHTYGSRGVWQMYTEAKEPYGPLNHYWYVAMDLPGAWDMKHVRDLILSRPYLERVPDQSLVSTVKYFGGGRLRATRGNRYAFVYSPLGYVIKLRMGVISGKTVTAWWFDPRTGEAARIASFPNAGFKEFDPPGEPGRDNDWVLVVDDEEAGFPAPGSVDLRYRSGVR